MLSDLIYGTWRILDEKIAPTPPELRARFELCLELGITTLDTAEIYGLYQVEEALGKIFAGEPGFRDRFQLVTKCGIDIPSPEKDFARVAHYNASADNLIRCAEKSLRLLNTDRLDLFLVHRPDWFASADETAGALSRLLAEGKVLQVGVSNYSQSQFALLNDRLGSRLFTNQVEFSLLNMNAMDDGTLAQCEQARIRPMAWSPLGGGKLFDSKDAAAVRVRECMAAIREHYDGADDDALAFAWVMAHPSRPHTILGTNQERRIRSQAKAAQLNMSRQDWYALWEAAKGHPVP